MKHLTKKEALQQFLSHWNEWVFMNPSLKSDRPAKCEAWNNFTDSLCKSGQISIHQYETWVNPF